MDRRSCPFHNTNKGKVLCDGLACDFTPGAKIGLAFVGVEPGPQRRIHQQMHLCRSRKRRTVLGITELFRYALALTFGKLVGGSALMPISQHQQGQGLCDGLAFDFTAGARIGLAFVGVEPELQRRIHQQMHPRGSRMGVGFTELFRYGRSWP